MRSKRPRARRYPVVATIEVTDVDEETQFVGLTSDVSVYGCAVNLRGLDIKTNLMQKGKTVRVRIIRAGTNFVAMGKVAHVNPGTEAGIAFTQVELHHQEILEKWIDQAKKSSWLDNPSRLGSGHCS